MSRLLGYVALLSILVQMYSSFRLYYVIAAEKPDWVKVPTPLARFYAGIPRPCVAPVQWEVLKIVFSARAHQLTSPAAAAYVRSIRFSLPLSVAALYLAVFFSP